MSLRPHVRDRLLSSRNRHLAFTVLIYLLLLPIFGYWYYYLHKSTPRSFAFNSDILKNQIESYKASLERELTNLRIQLDIFNRSSRGQTRLSKPPKHTQSNDYRHSLLLNNENSSVGEFPGPPKDSLSIPPHLTLGYDDESRLVVGYIDTETGFTNLPPDLVRQLIKRTEEQMNRVRDRLNSLSGSTDGVWSYWDFVYFSIITQTTVGYGDILPNSTLVRVSVALQALFGITLMGFAINFSFRKHKG